MKKTILFLLAISFLSIELIAQTDTMMVYQQGGIITKFSVPTIDSIVFKQYVPPQPNTVTDVQGNQYPTVVIGTQEWMAENLRATSYNDGTPIPYQHIFEQERADYVWYSQDSATYARPYGAYYNGPVIFSSGKNVCPVGWHVPSATEWTTLVNFLGGFSVAGGKLKQVGTLHWNAPNTGATNEVGFNAVGAGNVGPTNVYGNFHANAFFWTSTGDVNSMNAFQLRTGETTVYNYSMPATMQYSIRCMKD